MALKMSLRKSNVGSFVVKIYLMNTWEAHSMKMGLIYYIGGISEITLRRADYEVCRFPTWLECPRECEQVKTT